MLLKNRCGTACMRVQVRGAAERLVTSGIRNHVQGSRLAGDEVNASRVTARGCANYKQLRRRKNLK